LHKAIEHLKIYNPLFLDMTWGAGGSTSTLTLDVSKAMRERHGCNPNMHLTCTNMDTELIDHALASCKENGICNILALRGDPPVGQDRWTAADNSLSCAADLVRYIQSKHDDFFSISVAGYPEGHPAAMVEMPVDAIETLSETEKQRFCKDSKTVPGLEEGTTLEVPIIHVCPDEAFVGEMQYLKSKIDAGATFILTQMFFDVEVYGYFVKSCREYGITVPIIPGIMCVANYGGFMRMIKFCKTRVPDEVFKKMESLKDDPEGIKQYGIELVLSMCVRLKEMGVPGLHFYTLNSSHAVVPVLQKLGYHPNTDLVAEAPQV
jgi:methylenetetrahydrofolate reductase (NADPH)